VLPAPPSSTPTCPRKVAEQLQHHLSVSTWLYMHQFLFFRHCRGSASQSAAVCNSPQARSACCRARRQRQCARKAGWRHQWCCCVCSSSGPRSFCQICRQRQARGKCSRVSRPRSSWQWYGFQRCRTCEQIQRQAERDFRWVRRFCS
jgi:hypothetical protein